MSPEAKLILTAILVVLGWLAGWLSGCAGTGDYAGMSRKQWNDYEKRYWSKENHW